VSQRRACDVLQIDRSTVRYLSRRGDDKPTVLQPFRPA
jgi:putative transposase